MKNGAKKYDWLKPSLRDWFAFIIFAIFAVVSAFIIPGNRDLGIFCLTFFGLGSIVGGFTILRKLQESKFEGTQLNVIGGLNITPSRARLFLLSLSLVVLGGNMVIFGNATPLILQIIGGFLLLLGVVMTCLGLLKKLPVGFIRFDPDCFVIGKRSYSLAIPWDSIARIEPGDMNGNSAVFIWLTTANSIRTEPPDAIVSAHKAIVSTEQWFGCHFAILTDIYGLKGTILAGALLRYKQYPEAREELGKKYIPGNSLGHP